MKSAFLFTLIYIITFSNAIAGKKHEDINLLYFFHELDDNIPGAITHNYGLNHITAAGGSYALIESGFDQSYYEFMKDNRAIPRAGFASVIIGGLVPLTVPAGLYIYSSSAEDRDLKITSLALAQSAFISLAWTSALKAFTGRKPPADFDDPASEFDRSKDFAWGLMNRGVFDGWPSGHTTTAFAMASALDELYPEKTWLKWAAYGYAFFIGLGISTNIHWYTDFFAGAFMGTAIGKTVGSSFYKLKTGKENESALKIRASPMGIALSWNF